LLAQFGGRGNAAEILKIIDSMLKDEKWNSISGILYFHMALKDLKNTVNGSKIQVFQ